MKKILYVFYLLTLCMACRAMQLEGNGKPASASVALKDFDGLNSTIAANIVLQPGKSGPATVEGDENIINLIHFEYSGSTLVIKSSKNYSPKLPLKISIPIQSIQSIEISGAGNLSSTFPLKQKDLKLEISGSGGMELQLETEACSGEISGAGNLKLSGNTASCKMEISGSGNADCRNLNCRTANALVSGSGNCYVNPASSLDASISGSGKIYYFKPEIQVKESLTGSGKIALFRN